LAGPVDARPDVPADAPADAPVDAMTRVRFGEAWRADLSETGREIFCMIVPF
jgi:hypothetical protein